MSLLALNDRAIIGFALQQMGLMNPPAWVSKITNSFDSVQATETYGYLSSSPQMRAWVGGRQAKNLNSNTFTVTNVPYENTLVITNDDLRRGLKKELELRIQGLVKRAQNHPAKLLSALIVNGESTAGPDGQYFFDTDHTEFANTTSQSNDLSIDISNLPAQVAGSTTTPSAEEAALCVAQAIAAMRGFLDDESEPVNEDAEKFLVMTPTSLFDSFAAGVKNQNFAGGADSTLKAIGGSIEVVANARLDASWTEQVAVFRTDDPVAPLMIQEEEKITFAIEDDTFQNRRKEFGAYRQYEVSYADWKKACLITMT